MKAQPVLRFGARHLHPLGFPALFFVSFAIIVTVYLFIVMVDIAPRVSVKSNLSNLDTINKSTLWYEESENFKSLEDGITYIVPNIVHFIKFGDNPLSFVEAVCIRAAWLHQRPEKLMIHCDQCNRTVQSPLWYLIKDIPVLKLQTTVRPTEVFGIKFSYIQHASDVVRLQVLMKYGGIYLDSDSYIVKSLDPYRRYKMSIGWPPGANVGNQVLVAHKDTRYLKLCYESYREYRPDLWYWNAGVLPTERFLSVHPELVHSVPHDFGVAESDAQILYAKCDDSWKNYSAFHLFFRHIGTYVPPEPKRFGPITIDTVSKYDRNFGQLARLVLYGTTKLGASEIKSIDWLSRHPPEYSEYGCKLPASSPKH